MPIFKQFHKFIIGKGGATVKQIRQETNAKIDLPASGSDSDIIILTGKKEDVLKAQKKIQTIQSEQADVVSLRILLINLKSGDFLYLSILSNKCSRQITNSFVGKLWSHDSRKNS